MFYGQGGQGLSNWSWVDPEWIQKDTWVEHGLHSQKVFLGPNNSVLSNGLTRIYKYTYLPHGAKE